MKTTRKRDVAIQALLPTKQRAPNSAHIDPPANTTHHTPSVVDATSELTAMSSRPFNPPSISTGAAANVGGGGGLAPPPAAAAAAAAPVLLSRPNQGPLPSSLTNLFSMLVDTILRLVGVGGGVAQKRRRLGETEFGMGPATCPQTHLHSFFRASRISDGFFMILYTINRC
jgi:hypothetical protein